MHEELVWKNRDLMLIMICSEIERIIKIYGRRTYKEWKAVKRK